MFTSGFVDWVYNDLKIEQASGFHGKNIIVAGICSENPDGKLKKENPKTDTSQLENQIDQLVYKLYNLTPE